MFLKLQSKLLLLLAASCIIYLSGLHEYLFTSSYDSYYIHFGPSEDLTILIKKHHKEYLENNFLIDSSKCKGGEVDIVFLVKSKCSHFELRTAIRQTWGNESNFVGLKTKAVFMLGDTQHQPLIQSGIKSEVYLYNDIVQGYFIDSYYNNTRKTQMTINWAIYNCHSNYYVLIDDDYFLSPKNLIKFIQSPHNYPGNNKLPTPDEYLYAGYVFANSAPIRYYFSKWYIPLREYKYSRWPPYITGGVVVFAKKALDILYVASQHTDFFKFDDIFVGMAAKKGGLNLTHNNEFHFDKKSYSQKNYRNVIASHGYNSASELVSIFNRQIQLGEI